MFCSLRTWRGNLWNLESENKAVMEAPRSGDAGSVEYSPMKAVGSEQIQPMKEVMWAAITRLRVRLPKLFGT